ncbi:hypothetical protein BU23DRAFT_517391 [Bimuria novae-zelandiae CBS 107.79]|uniref:Uncharacterized protein n=1 Tax=Bimuria novae-zelandiae CBS 107.79 TaxID=1447943 RepID=A0A6A5USK1_9PLEO|nr:hypothetical protein BU23DRAFT_517391 [Bimuria novae-zelandiae CBS 107.79]
MSKPKKTSVPLPSSTSKTPIPLPSGKKTPIPLPGSSSKNPKTKVAANQLSQEFVGDSDNSSDEATTKAGAAQKKAPINIAVHRPNSNGVAKPATEAKNKHKDTQKTPAKQVVPPKKPAPKQVTEEEEGADTSSEDESSDDAETDIKQAQQRETQKKQQEDSDSDISPEDSSDESEEEAAPVPQWTEARSAQSQAQTVSFQQARPYVPPEDFKTVPTERAANSSNTNMLKNLNGKQIWHITAPEDVSLKDLRQLAMDKARKGEAVLEHKGTSYGFAQAEDGADGVEVLIPVANGYKAVPTRISQSFHVQKIVNLPKLTSRQADQNTGSEAAASITASTIRAVKPQVKGLKMRFFPSGFEGSAPATLGDSEDEEDAAASQPAGLGIPKGLPPPAKKEKRKHSKGEADMEVPVKKHKKQRTEEEQARRDEKKAKKEKKKEKKSKS